MHLIETITNQRAQLPLPAAHVIIDMRGISDDRAMEWLQAEIEDLAGEMKSRDVYHWRNLAHFLSFKRIHPNGSNPTAPDESPSMNMDDAGFGLVGQVHAEGPHDMLFNEDLRAPESAEDMPFTLFEQQISELLLEIDRVRSNRIAAVKDLNRAAIPGRSRRDATVRVVFLTDLDHPESLKSAAMYADRLKSYSRKMERQGHQPMLNTVVVCLNNTGEAGPPARLIQGLSLNNKWDHIDSLILSENYREDAALISSTTQAYITELMLYVLLTIPPFGVSAPQNNGHHVSDRLSAGYAARTQSAGGSAGGNESTFANGSTQVVDTQDAAQQLSLPVNTYVVGLAALEYSSRWGRRWLNFGLAKDSIDILRQQPDNPGKEHITLADLATSWFMGWRQRVRAEIPDRIPGTAEDVPALDGIRRAQQASQNDKIPFTSRRFGFHIGKSTIKDLNAYLAGLTSTYVSSGSDLAMEDALIQSSGQIMQVLNQQKCLPEREREKSELVNRQIEAERVLNHPKFFRGATGAIPRALMQLEALKHTIEHFNRDHLHKALHPQSTRDSLVNRRGMLEARGRDMINNLKAHLARWPFLVGEPTPRLIMAIITMVLIAFVMGIAVFTGAAWLHHLLFARFDGLLPYVDSVLLGVPVLAFVAVIVFLLLLLVELISLRPALLRKQGSGLYIEVAFFAALAVIVLFGWLIGFSIDTLGLSAGDTLSIYYLAWLAFMPGVAFVAAIVGLVLFIIEVVYFFWWLDYLRRERRRIVRDLRMQHRGDIEEVIDFIADEVALEMAQQAELVDGKGGPGPYHSRLTRLSKLLDWLTATAQAQQQSAADRVLYKQGEMQQRVSDKSGDVWLNLHIRDERLETEPLTDAYKGLRQQLANEDRSIKELAEFILRSEGSENPANIEREFLEERDIFASSERRLRLFLTSLVAIAMRFAIDPQSLRNIKPIDEEYLNIDSYTGEEIPALTSLVKMLNQSISQVELETSSNFGQTRRPTDAAASSKSLAVRAAALWGQFFWLHTDPQLDERLMTDGILKHLDRQLGDDYDPRAVMRRLLIHTVLFGRSLPAGQRVECALLLAPSEQSYHFRQGLKSLPLPRIIDFPDVERIVLLAIKRFVAEPMQIQPPAQTSQPALPSPDGGSGPAPDNSQTSVSGSAAVNSSQPSFANGSGVLDSTLSQPVNGSVVSGNKDASKAHLPNSSTADSTSSI